MSTTPNPVHLTHTEAAVMRVLERTKTPAGQPAWVHPSEISQALDIAESTVRVHVYAIRQKAGATVIESHFGRGIGYRAGTPFEYSIREPSKIPQVARRRKPNGYMARMASVLA